MSLLGGGFPVSLLGGGFPGSLLSGEFPVSLLGGEFPASLPSGEFPASLLNALQSAARTFPTAGQRTLHSAELPIHQVLRRVHPHHPLITAATGEATAYQNGSGCAA